MREKDAMTPKETLKETNRLKSNCNAKSNIYAHNALLMIRCLSLLFLPWPCLCTESMPETTEANNAITPYAYAIYEITKPQSCCKILGDSEQAVELRLLSACTTIVTWVPFQTTGLQIRGRRVSVLGDLSYSRSGNATMRKCNHEVKQNRFKSLPSTARQKYRRASRHSYPFRRSCDKDIFDAQGLH